MSLCYSMIIAFNYFILIGETSYFVCPQYTWAVANIAIEKYKLGW